MGKEAKHSEPTAECSQSCPKANRIQVDVRALCELVEISSNDIQYWPQGAPPPTAAGANIPLALELHRHYDNTWTLKTAEIQKATHQANKMPTDNK